MIGVLLFAQMFSSWCGEKGHVHLAGTAKRVLCTEFIRPLFRHTNSRATYNFW